MPVVRSDKVSDVSILNAAIRAELESAMELAGFASPNDYFVEYEIDRRNFYRTLRRDPQISWIMTHTERLGVPIGEFFDRVDVRLRESAKPETA